MGTGKKKDRFMVHVRKINQVQAGRVVSVYIYIFFFSSNTTTIILRVRRLGCRPQLADFYCFTGRLRSWCDPVCQTLPTPVSCVPSASCFIAWLGGGEKRLDRGRKVEEQLQSVQMDGVGLLRCVSGVLNYVYLVRYLYTSGILGVCSDVCWFSLRIIIIIHCCPWTSSS